MDRTGPGPLAGAAPLIAPGHLPGRYALHNLVRAYAAEQAGRAGSPPITRRPWRGSRPSTTAFSLTTSRPAHSAGRHSPWAREVGHRRFAGYAWDGLGYAGHHLGNFAEAAARYQRAVSQLAVHAGESGADFGGVGVMEIVEDGERLLPGLPGVQQLADGSTDIAEVGKGVGFPPPVTDGAEDA